MRDLDADLALIEAHGDRLPAPLRNELPASALGVAAARAFLLQFSDGDQIPPVAAMRCAAETDAFFAACRSAIAWLRERRPPPN